MPGDALRVITHALGVSPVSIFASLFGWVRRPRLWWLNWNVAAYDGLSITAGRNLGDGFKVLKVVCPASRGKPEDWLAAKSSWPGMLEQRPLPTSLRWVPRKKPPGRPKGLAECSAEDLACWQQAKCACSPYNSSLRNGIVRPSGAAQSRASLNVSGSWFSCPATRVQP